MARRAKEVSVADVVPSPARRPEAKAFAEIAGRSKSFRPAREVLKRVRAVPTIFPAVDWKTRVGGWPTERVSLIHGPSGKGKSLFMHGIGLSFLRRGHMYCPVDAEATTPFPWVESLMGEEAHNPGFVASRPQSYEQVVDDVRRIANGLAEARAKERVPPETTCLFAIDSIRKLVPEDLMARIKKLGASGDDGSIDGYSGASGMMRAALNAAWLDELVPLMFHTGCAILFIGREAEDTNASPRDKKFGKDWRLTGGKSLFLDSSLVARVSSSRMVREGSEESGVVVGERHLVEIHKTKVSARQDYVEKAFFHTSNGARHPEGFDRARDILELSEELGTVKKSGSWISFARKRWQSEARFVATVEPTTLDEMEAACRERFGDLVKERAEIVGGE
jgi:recombination protein RecA